MDEDCALYLARRVRQLYSLSTPPTIPELEAVCRARGIDVVWSCELRDSPGACILLDETATIILRWDATPLVFAHEVFHAILKDNGQHGVVYLYTELPAGGPEQAAQQFALYLCEGMYAPEPAAGNSAAFHERYECLLGTTALRGCPPMRGTETLTPAEADALLDALKEAVRRFGPPRGRRYAK